MLLITNDYVWLSIRFRLEIRVDFVVFNMADSHDDHTLIFLVSMSHRDHSVSVYQATYIIGFCVEMGSALEYLVPFCLMFLGCSQLKNEESIRSECRQWINHAMFPLSHEINL